MLLITESLLSASTWTDYEEESRPWSLYGRQNVGEREKPYSRKERFEDIV